MPSDESVGFDDSVRSSVSDQGSDRPARCFWGWWSPGLGDGVLRYFGTAQSVIEEGEKRWSKC